MKATELRIGNYLKYPILKIKVNASLLLAFENNKGYIDLYQPIELSEEILLKCGFEKIENNWKVLDFIYFKISWERLAGLALTFENESVYLPHIKYLHQLQNLIHALTNEELTVNL